ncbi:hypothetical protein BDP27DRAFT_1423183 [Rhodocollybia butyracea]|uniref:Nephrocystin 3-like N-terminal domain-containing protein n=1 Tax=Rhodocollybia butyracea TaxID=206335 RepID=A0A9P5PQ28_9AGAR|nr:hypothetical protein BDP27DRAFT_1423183 [Rhodocollybia butyracea]
MSFFENSQRFEVIGGNFYAVAGDVNIEKASSSSSSRADFVQTLRTQRSEPGGVRYSPYNVSTRPRRRLASHASSHLEELEKSGTLMTSDIATFDSTSFPQRLPQSQLSGTMVSLYPGSGQFLSLAPPRIMDSHIRPTTTINDCTFVSNTRQGEKGIDKLHSVAALEALHDSVESFPQPRCHPETRMKMLEDLQKWSQETDPASSCILWLFGPAGAGKSAIMRTLSHQLQSTGRLGGCFFFKRGHQTRGNAKVLFVTIAYQLAISVPWLKVPISQVVEADPSILARSIETQLQKLISEPCRMHPDEALLRYSLMVSMKHPRPLRIIIASRPEAHIREMFESPVYYGVYQALNVEQSFSDVRTYFLDEFARIHHEHHQIMAAIPLPWPLPIVLNKLVEKSSGYFIYASTIIKFIDDKNYRPTEQLAIVMKDQDSAFDTLDQLYINILSTVPIAKHPKLISILCALTNFRFSARGLDKLLGLEIGDTRLFLRNLHSIFNLPSEENPTFSGFPWDAISTHHASFYDFLGDSKRSQNFYVGSLHHRMDLACSILRSLAHGYQDRHGHPQSPQQRFPHFIASLPPSASAELLAFDSMC